MRYRSFRAYLRDVFATEKASSRRTTLATFGGAFGLSGPTLQMIFAGKRNLTIETMNAIARVLKLSEAERHYFEALVLYEQATNPETRKYYRKKLAPLSRKPGIRRLRVSERRFVSEWYVPSLLIYYLDFVDPQSDASAKAERLRAFAKALRLNAEQMTAAVAVIDSLVKLDRNSKGFHLTYERLASNTTQIDYLKSVVGEVHRRMEREFSRSQSAFHSFTFTAPADSVPALREDLIAVFEKYMGLGETGHEEKTIMQAFIGVTSLL